MVTRVLSPGGCLNILEYHAAGKTAVQSDGEKSRIVIVVWSLTTFFQKDLTFFIERFVGEPFLLGITDLTFESKLMQ